MIAARLMLLACVTFWGWSFVATKIAVEYVTPVELLALRYLFGLPILFAVLLLKKISLKFNKRDNVTILIGSAILTIHFLIQITGLQWTSATNTGWIISVTPLVIAVLAFLFLKEKITISQAIGVLVATIGILLLVSKGDLTDLSWLSSVGDWLVLASAHTWAIYTIVTRDISMRGRPLAVTISILTPSALIVWLYISFTSDFSKFFTLPLEPLLALLFLGVFAMGLSQWFWQEGISRIGAARSGFFLYLEPLATTALAVPYLNEEFGLFTAIGGLMVLAGVYVAENRKRDKIVLRPQGDASTGTV